jgi:hypothetical protein
MLCCRSIGARSAMRSHDFLRQDSSIGLHAQKNLWPIGSTRIPERHDEHFNGFFPAFGLFLCAVDRMPPRLSGQFHRSGLQMGICRTFPSFIHTRQNHIFIVVVISYLVTDIGSWLVTVCSLRYGGPLSALGPIPCGHYGCHIGTREFSKF